MLNLNEEESSSFKDPDARVYVDNKKIFRKIFPSYFCTYKKFMHSGLYNELISKNLIIPHKEISSDSNCIIIEPEKVFISYPWEWCFSELKNAALSTLEIQLLAIDYGFSLKDANCFNIQFYKNKPVLIDTSSFEEYKEGTPWVAYKQFCENFIAPLALMAYKDINLNSLFLSNINGISLELASKLLPIKTYFNFNIFTHIHIHSKFQSKYSNHSKKETDNIFIPKNQLKNLIKNLYNTVKNINLKNISTEWGNYYDDTNYSEESFESKKLIIEEFKQKISPKTVWDFGSNTGVFSRIFKDSSTQIAAFDIDKSAVEKNYLKTIKEQECNILPLVLDLANPSPALGFANNERKNIFDRAENVDLILALALIHHLKFTYNIPFELISKCFSSISKYVIIEFVDKEDSQVKRMLLNRKDVFEDYTQENFEQCFSKFFNIKYKKQIKDTKRTLYLMEKNN